MLEELRGFTHKQNHQNEQTESTVEPPETQRSAEPVPASDSLLQDTPGPVPIPWGLLPQHVVTEASTAHHKHLSKCVSTHAIGTGVDLLE